jgi:peroxiredoxin
MKTAYIFNNNRISTKALFTARSTHYEHYPLVKGNAAPSFRITINDKIDFGTTEQISLNDLLADQKPLVMLFYTVPGKHTIKNTLLLESLQPSLKSSDANFLGITGMQHAGIKYNSSLRELRIITDENNTIAKAFGLYDPTNPLWNWVPGIEESEAFLPALYVITPDKKIAYHYIDYNFSLFNHSSLLQEALIKKLQDSVEQAIHSVSTYYPVSNKLVS